MILKNKSVLFVMNLGILKKKLFVAFPWVVTSTEPGGFMICVFIL